MSYITDVAFCVKPGIVVPEFEKIEDCFGVVVRDDRGILYVAESVKWYSGIEVVIAVTEFLEGLESDDYLFIELDTNNGTGGVELKGGFHDNGFGLGYIFKLTYEAIS